MPRRWHQKQLSMQNQKRQATSLTDETLGTFTLGITYRRKHIWLSELAGGIFVGITLFCISGFGAVVFVNEHRIHVNNRTISRLATERILLSQALEELREQEMISFTLTEFGRGRLSRQTINMLVDLVYRNSRTYGYDPLLVLAVINVESYFETGAMGQFKSGNFSGAMGLMQIKLETAREVARDLGITIEKTEDIFDPEINIALGVGYLTKLIASFKSLKLGILAYNQGPGVIRESISGKRPLSQQYYQKVLQNYFKLKEMHQKRLDG
jgi:hypothetical protein